MGQPLRVLIVEDSEDDTLLVVRELKRGGYIPVFERVESEEDMLSALDKEERDLIIADYAMPCFSGTAALNLYKAKDLDIPFILVSGTVGDDVGVQAMIDGAHDYICKSNLSRLVPAINRELREAEIRKARKAADRALRRARDELEKRVQERTAELALANAALKAEIEERKRVEKALRISKRELTIRNRISDVFLSMSDESLYEKVLDIILESAKSKSGIFGYINGDGALVCPTLNGKISETCGLWERQIVFPRERWRGTVWGRALKGRKSIVSNGSVRVPEGHAPILRALTTPIVYRGEAIGVIAVANKRTEYNDSDRRLLETIARKIAPVLHARRQRDAQEAKRRQAKEALRESEEKYRSVVEESLVGVYIAQNGILVFVNRKFCEIYGYVYEEIVNRLTLYDLVHPDDRHILEEGIRRRMEGETDFLEFEFRGVHKSGKTITLKGLGSASFLQSNPAIMGTVIDVTREKTLEQQLLHAQKMEAIGTLAGGIAHDFNNILAAIIGFTEMIRGRVQGNAEMRRYVDHVLKAGTRGKDLVRQMLTFSRHSEKELKPVRLSSIIQEPLKLLRASLPSTIHIKQEIMTDSFVLADATQIHQVLMNLSTNAAHSMREKGGVLGIRLSDFSFSAVLDAPHQDMIPGSYVRLSVADTGCGMSREVLKRVFDPFFTTKETGEGTGLGLSVVHGIVKGHKGAVTVESETGKGSVFTIYFPRAEQGSEIFEEVDYSIPRGHERILFVDDEDMLIEMGKHVLEGLGYEVVIKADGLEALSAFREESTRFDLVITDQTMPYMTGTDLARELILVKPDIPIVLCTGFSELVNAESSKAFGIKAFLMKPFTVQEIARTIRRVLDGESETVQKNN
jgi:PAS domain S-box-containing protein